ncbi:MAG TPA: sigma-70 family RNA polymerase sigma factor [Candidatus Dormibacteraeota bacterium]|nr:sigma-70 family RNA polymerase sigma factor [Candidatus Dormibacteraeota bacterium]
MNGQERDRSCLEGMRTGDTRALEELYERHNGLLYSVVLRILREAQGTEQVLRESWLQIWRGPGGYNVARGNVGAWLLTVARNRAIARLKSDGLPQRAEPAAGGDVPAPTEDASANAAHRQMSERVRRALDVLGPQHRQVLELAYFGGLTQGEIADRLNTSPGTIKSWSRQALVRIGDLVPHEDWT